MQGGRAFVNWMDPAGLLALEPTDKKELVFCEFASDSVPCLYAC